MTLPFEIVCDSADRDAWLEQRRSTIGASESAIVLGQSPDSWPSPLALWAVKTGRMEAKSLEENEAVFWGLELEGGIISGFQKRSKRTSVPFGLLLRSTRYPWLSATPDALTTDDPEAAKRAGDLAATIRALASRPFLRTEGVEELLQLARGWWPLQVKNIGFRSAHHWANGVPPYYTIQCTQEALVFGATRCTGAALIAGQRLAWDDVEVQPASVQVLPPLAAQLVDMTRAFWDDYVLADVEPSPDASESAKHALAALYPIENPEEIKQLGLDYLELAREQDRLSAEHSRLEKRIKQIKNEIRAAMGNAAEAYFADGSGYTHRSISKQAYTVDACSYRDLRRKKAKGGD
jgi:putative phage-type endonuclease